jgi:type IX secretion system substrate protein
MKNLLLLAIFGALSLNGIAQNHVGPLYTSPQTIGTSLNQISPDQMRQLSQSSPFYAAHHAHDTKRLIPGLASYNDWYDMWDQNYNGATQGYYLAIYPDSNLVDDYMGGSTYTGLHGAGMSFDPTDSGYSYNAITTSVGHPMPLTGQGYTIDSFYIPIVYLRNNPLTTVVDSVIIEIIVTSEGPFDSGSYQLGLAPPLPGYYTPITYNDSPRFADVHYNNGLDAPYNVNPYINDCYFDSIRTRKYRYALPLTNANKYDTSLYGYMNLNQSAHMPALPLSPAIPVYSSGTHAVSYVSFKSGVAYPFGTHASVANIIHCFAGEPNGFSTWFMQSTSNPSLGYPGSYQSSLFTTNTQRYNSSGYTFDYHNVLNSGYAYSAPGLSVTFDQWHITWTCTTPGVGAVLGGSSTLCVSSTMTLSDTASSGVWSVANGNASVSGAGVVTGLSAGVDTIIYTKSNGCGTVTAIKAITVNPLPIPGTITGPSIVCTGATITLTDAAAGGVWSATNSKATVSGGMVSGVAVGTDTIEYKVTNTCGTRGATKLITIGPAPDPGTISGPSGVCIGSSITLTDAATGGTWSTSIGNATVSAGVVSGVSIGIDTVSYTATSSCGSAATQSVVTINPLPVPVIVNTDGLLSTTVAYASYQWNLSGTPITGETNSTYTAVINGAYTVSVVDANGCTATTDITVVALSVQDINSIANNIRIYPNPAQYILNIETSVPVNIQLASMDGRVIMTLQNVKTIDLSNLPNGSYLLNIYDAGNNLKLKTERVVKLSN